MWMDDVGQFFALFISILVGVMIMAGVNCSIKAEQDHEYRMKQLELRCGNDEEIKNNE